jgi:CRP/FNR family transcriptional regulator, cyclic AMP receptor protein
VHVITVDVFGWLAGTLVLATFCLRTMLPLRCVAIASNLAFITYGLMAGALPIVVLHLALLPMNVVRLQEMRALARRVRRAARETPCLDALVPHGRVRRVAAGTALFRAGDGAKDVYLILEGRVRIAGTNTAAGPGELLGEKGIFAPGQRHPESAVCESEVSLASVGKDKLWEVFYRDPEFAAHLLRLIVSRGHDRALPPPGGPARLSSLSAPPRSRDRDGDPPLSAKALSGLIR